MDALTALTTRASALKLAEPGPIPEHREIILRAAVSAPNHGRLGTWRFILIEGDARVRFGEVLATSLLGRNPDTPAITLEAESRKALRAPLIIVVAVSPIAHPSIPEIEQIVAAGAAAQNVLLAAHALGYGAFWRTGAAAYDLTVKAALGLGPNDSVVGFLYVGTVNLPGKAKQVEVESHVTRWLVSAHDIGTGGRE